MLKAPSSIWALSLQLALHFESSEAHIRQYTLFMK